MSAEQVVATMEIGGSEVAVIVPKHGPLGSTWTEHLLAQTDPTWRSGEWDSTTWEFVPDPTNAKTRLFVCPRIGCDVRVAGRTLCMTCQREQRANDWSLEEATAKPRLEPAILRSNRRRPDCVVEVAGVACKREQLARTLCSGHYQTFAKANSAGVSDEILNAWVAQPTRPPLERLADCAVVGCGHERQSEQVDLCSSHHQGRRREMKNDPALSNDDFMQWIAEPHLPAYSLPLVVLPNPLRAELLLAMQTFDAERGLDWDAANWVRLFDRLREARVHSVLDRPASDWLDGADGTTLHMWRHFLHRINIEDDRYHERESDEAVLSSFDLGLSYKGKKPNKSIAHRQRPIDFTQVSQPWLRKVVVHYIRVIKPPMEDIRRLETLLPLVSQHLRETMLDSDDTSSLNGGVMDSIVALINRNWTTARTQQNYLTSWWKVCHHASRNDLWLDVPKSFERSHALHKPTGTVVEDDENGEALPEAVVRHMSRYLNRLGENETGMTRSGWTPTLRGLHYRALATVMRDTGRRPNEVVALLDNCVQPDVDGVSWVLIWDNTKSKRLNRRLVIDSHTVAAITEWQQHKKDAGIESVYLFPSSNSADFHTSTGTLERALNEWIAVVPPLAFPILHLDGVKRVFDFGSIVPYSFRHTYAQRLADTGTSPKTLSELMDHRSMNTTMGYYRAGWERKREAQERMSAYTLDRHGDHAPIPEGRRGLSQVAVPWGSCTEPSNVQAAGHACPTRFKCVGCGFYRPDPSYTPAIETHIDELRTEVAFLVANESPAYMIEASRQEIADYEKVVDKLNDELDALPAAEREEIELRMAILRRARTAEAAGFSFTLEPADMDNTEDEL